MIACLVSSILLGLGGFLVYAYYHRKGQFEDFEEVKYQMFHEEELERKTKQGE